MDRRRFLGHSAAFLTAISVGCTRTPLITALTLRPGGERGQKELDWLSARYSFSFSKYRSPTYSGFRSLRVMNEDRIQPGGGFPMHGHRDMEIVTYVLDGALEHRDTLGNGAVIQPGTIQQMSAGSGIRHSEFNPLAASTTHLYQIWFLPAEEGVQPGYAEADFPTRDGALRLIASGSGAEGSIRIHQDASLLAGRLKKGQVVPFEQVPGRGTWIQVCRGEVSLNGRRMVAGDGAHTESAGRLELKALESAEVLLFDLA
jgi:redox-sensitive bicupin YhaK (pirin superfamily)